MRVAFVFVLSAVLATAMAAAVTTASGCTVAAACASNASCPAGTMCDVAGNCVDSLTLEPPAGDDDDGGVDVGDEGEGEGEGDVGEGEGEGEGEGGEGGEGEGEEGEGEGEGEGDEGEGETTPIHDDFDNRTAVGSWGAPSSGAAHEWHCFGDGNPAFAVDRGMGRVGTSVPEMLAGCILTPLEVRDIEIESTVNASRDDPPEDAPPAYVLVAARATDTTDVGLELELDPAGSSVAIYVEDPQNVTYLGMAGALGGGPDDRRRVLLRIVDTPGGTLITATVDDLDDPSVDTVVIEALTSDPLANTAGDAWIGVYTGAPNDEVIVDDVTVRPL